MRIATIILGFLLSLIPFTIVEAKSIWIVYEKADVQPYPLLGYLVIVIFNTTVNT